MKNPSRLAGFVVAFLFCVTSSAQVLTFSHQYKKFRFEVSGDTVRWSSDHLYERLSISNCPMARHFVAFMKDIEMSLKTRTLAEVLPNKGPSIPYQLDGKSGSAPVGTRMGQKLKMLPVKLDSLTLHSRATCKKF